MTRESETLRSLYVVVEKILGHDEPFPDDWRTHGTSGYEALNRINGLFVDPASAAEFTRRYHGWIGDQTPYREVVRQKKLLILEVSLASELHVLAYQLERIALRDRRSRDFTQSGLRHVLEQVIASFPVYRCYITAERVSEQDRAIVDRAIRLAMRRNPMTSRAIFRFLRNVLLDRVKRPDDLPADEPEPADFAGKFQQVTAPVMAKGLEDTCFYNYNRLVSLNEVGGIPADSVSVPTSFTAGTSNGPPVSPTHLPRSRPTTPSVARTCGPGSTCCPRFRIAGFRPSSGGMN